MDPKKVRTAFAKIGYSTKGEAMVEAWDQRGEKVAEGSLKSLLQSPFANMDSSYDKYIIPAAENLFDQVKDWLGLLGPYEERVEVCVCLWMWPGALCVLSQLSYTCVLQLRSGATSIDAAISGF